MKNSLIVILLSLSALYFLCSGCEKSDISNEELLAWYNASGGTSGTTSGGTNGTSSTSGSTSGASSTSTSSTSSGGASVEHVWRGESIGTAVAGFTAYNGLLNSARIPLKPGSLTIVCGTTAYVFTDGGGGTLSSATGATGTINYGTGAWSINLNGVDLPAGTAITANYVYLTSS